MKRKMMILQSVSRPSIYLEIDMTPEPIRASIKPKPAKCRVCRELLIPQDRSLGVCGTCYRPHSSPTCASGFCCLGKGGAK